MTQAADSNAIRSYAAECATATRQDCGAEEITRTLTLNNRQISDLYLIDTGDVIVSDEQREMFGAEYRKALTSND